MQSFLRQQPTLTEVVLARPAEPGFDSFPITTMQNTRGLQTYATFVTEELTSGLAKMATPEFKQGMKKRHGIYLL